MMLGRVGFGKTENEARHSYYCSGVKQLVSSYLMG